MKVLIVDDQMRRYQRLRERLDEVGLPRDSIQIVPCADDARDRLADTYFDLLILDLLLPLLPESEHSVQHSLDLLFEVHNGNSLRKPGRVVGITEDLQVAADVGEQFDELTWNIIEYSANNDEWLNRIVSCIRYIQSQSNDASQDEPTFGIDLAIICALEKPELEEVLKLPWNWSAARPINDIVFVHDGHFESAGKRFTVAATFAPRMGMVSTALRSASVIAALKPRLIAMCGICAGVRSKVKIGDVLLADPAWDFQSGKRVKDTGNTSFSIAPHQLYTPSIIRTHVEQIRSDKGALAAIATEFGDTASLFNVVIGPVASGSAVLADGEVIEEIKTQHRELVGVEMESYGLYAAATTAPRPQPHYFSLKSVCDFADPDKADNSQKFAAYTSARVLQLLMERYGNRLLA